MSERPKRAGGHGGWRSPITAKLVTDAQNALGVPGWWRGSPVVGEARPSERGRTALLSLAEDPARELAPSAFNARTRLNEYGGLAWGAAGDALVAVDDADQRLHLLHPPQEGAEGRPVALSPESGKALRYAEPVVDLRRGRVLAVVEDHRPEVLETNGEPRTFLGAVPLDGSAALSVLASGRDFYAYPRLSPDGSKLAWITWDHPAMPWDGTTLWLADLNEAGQPGEPTKIAGGVDESVLQPEWAEDGALLFVSDRSGFWSPYEHVPGAEPKRLWEQQVETGYPLWQSGMRWMAPLPGRRLTCAFTENGRWRMALLDRNGGEARVLRLATAEGDAPVEVAGVCAQGSSVLFLAGFEARPQALCRFDADALDGDEARLDVLREAGELPVDPSWISRPRSVSFPSEGGRTAKALHYPPRNPEVEKEGEPDGLPPLIVRSHGGPTSCASPSLRLAYQFWTSRGFAVIDVDYAGSSGYGREYRDALKSAWGVADVEDCVAAARHLVEQGLADPERLIIAGGSAGGYTTLAALAFKDTFKAGCSSYGVGDLETLARDTHKFESRYLDTLVGPYPERADLYKERSPINHVDELDCPVIFFQGGEDKVVPPNQTEAMVEALDGKGLPVAYVLFPNEGHGFRQAANKARQLEAEHAFYRRVFGIEGEEPLAELEIRNLGEGA